MIVRRIDSDSESIAFKINELGEDFMPGLEVILTDAGSMDGLSAADIDDQTAPMRCGPRQIPPPAVAKTQPLSKPNSNFYDIRESAPPSIPISVRIIDRRQTARLSLRRQFQRSPPIPSRSPSDRTGRVPDGDLVAFFADRSIEISTRHISNASPAISSSLPNSHLTNR
jgi:hypothetical protein